MLVRKPIERRGNCRSFEGINLVRIAHTTEIVAASVSGAVAAPEASAAFAALLPACRVAFVDHMQATQKWPGTTTFVSCLSIMARRPKIDFARPLLTR
jgi:hypothetical protein